MSDAIVIIDGNLFVRFNGELRPLPRGGSDDDPTKPPEGGEPVTPTADAETPPAVGVDPAAAPVEDAIPDLPADMATIDEDALYTLHDELGTALGSRRETARTPADVESVRSIVERQNAIAAEIERRRTEAAEVADALTALDQSLPQALPERQPEPALAGAGATAAQLAAVRVTQNPGEQSPPAPRAQRPQVVMLAAAGAEIVPAGTPIDYEQIGAAFDRVKDKAGGDAILASIPAFTASDVGVSEILSRETGIARTGALIREAVEDWRQRQAWYEAPRQASPVAVDGDARLSSICEPFDIIRDIPDDFLTDEPVRGIYPNRPASRQGYQFMQSIGLADVLGGAAMWSDEQQAAIDPDDSSTWKACVEVDCPEIESITAEVITACLTYDITTEMSTPERVRNFMNALMALKARIKEGRILQRSDQLSINWQFFGDYGALPAVVEGLNTVLAQLTFQNRLGGTNYVLLVPPGVHQLLTIDRANRGFNQESTDDVMNYLRANVEGVSSIVQTLDASLGGEPGVPFVNLPAVDAAVTPVTVPYISGRTFRFRLIEPSSALYSETGEINVGVTRDSRLIRQNKTQFFAEELFFLSKHGPHAWATLDVTLCADGALAGLIEPTACVTS